MTNPDAVKKEIYLESDAGAFHLISFQRQYWAF
jgi:hypothetical protein